MKHGFAYCWLACVLAVFSACYGQNPKRPGVPKAKAQPLTEDRLRIRLQINPHDEAAHQTLIDLLHKRYSFRGVVLEDAVWIKNNPGAYLVLDELESYATAALRDPEFAITQETTFLAHAVREQDDFQYDMTKARLAGELTKRGRPEAALPLVDELIKFNPEDASLWADRAPPLLRLGRMKEAIESLRNALNGDPSSEGIHEALADALLRSGDLSAAESEYRAAISVYDAKYKKGDISSSLDSLTKKLVEIEQKNHEEHSLARKHLKLARILKMQKKWNDAVAQTKKALEVDKNGLGALFFQAQIYDAAGNPGEAAKSRQLATDSILKLSADSHFNNGKEKIDPRLMFLRESLFDSDSEESSFPSEIVSILEPRLATLSAYERIILADVYLDLNKFAEATKQWDQALSADPSLDNAIAHGNFGQRLLGYGRSSEALPHLKRAYELNPQNMTYRVDYERASQGRSAH